MDARGSSQSAIERSPPGRENPQKDSLYSQKENAASVPAAVPTQVPLQPNVTQVQSIGFTLDINAIMRENQELRFKYETLSRELATVNYHKLVELQEQYEETLEQLESQAKQLQDLEAENKALRNLVEDLQAQLEGRDKVVSQLQQTVEALGESVRELQQRDGPITVREVMRNLEGAICLRVAGSNRQFRLFYNFSKFREAGRENELDAIASADARNLIGMLKDVGNRATHDGRSLELASLQRALQDEGDTEGDRAVQEEVITLLRQFQRVDASGIVQ